MSQASRGPQLHVVPGAEPAAAGPTPSALPPGTASPRTAPAGTAPADAARAPSKGVVSQLPRKSAGQWNIKAASKTSRAVTSPAHLLNQKLAGALGARQADTKDGDWEEF
jgi:methyl-accepting chemotaxis protein